MRKSSSKNNKDLTGEIYFVQIQIMSETINNCFNIW